MKLKVVTHGHLSPAVWMLRLLHFNHVNQWFPIMFDRHSSQDDLFHFYFILDLSSSDISLQVLNSILRLNAEAHGLSIAF